MHLPKEPLRRFIDIFQALNAERGWFSDASSLKFASMAAITCEGDASIVASSIREIAEELKERSGWFGELNGSLRFIVAAMLLQNNDRAADFMTEVERVRALFRSARLKRGGSYEVMAILILRGSDKQPVQESDLVRFKAIYEEMRKHHWWITGVDDFPACAILVRQKGSPEAIGHDVEAIYQELKAVGFKKGNPLQTAANLLYLAGEKPNVIAARYHALTEAFRRERTRIWQAEYDELAILSFLADPAIDVVAQVLRNQQAISELRPKPGRPLAFNLASSITFVELVQSREDVEGVTDAKAMMDMQAIINAQQAAVIAATTAAAAASTAASSGSGG